MASVAWLTSTSGWVWLLGVDAEPYTMIMTVWVLSLVVINIFLGLAIGVLWIRMARPPKEDPRLSRGLQLLQSKITILEDLSDRTDVQVRQLIAILDERARGLQAKLLTAEEMLIKIEGSMMKSLDVAKIFQDKIPHQEIIERNQTSKYVLAAKLAHEGQSVQEILGQVDLPESEVEFIAKVNRDELSFDPNLLPEWTKMGEISTPDLRGLEMVENNFKQAVHEYEDYERQELARVQAIEARADHLKQSAVQMAERLANQAVDMTTKAAAVTGVAAQKAAQATAVAATRAAATMTAKAEPVIRKVQFPRIHIDKNP